jgi:hypothetical protein
MDQFKSARPFCTKVLDAMQKDDGLFFYGFYRPNIQYYMHRCVPVVKDAEEVVRALKKFRRVFLILQWKQKDMLAVEEPYVMRTFTRSKIGSRDVLCVVTERAEKSASYVAAPLTPSPPE